jgi:sensor histidine kinase YesM
MNEYSDYSTKRRLAAHTIFWLIWIVSFTFLQSFGYPVSDFGAWLVYYLFTLPIFMTHTYLIVYWLVPQYFFKNQYFNFSLWVLALLILSSIAELILSNEIIWKLVKYENIQKGNYLNLSNILINGIGNEYIILVFLSIKVIRFWNLKKGEKSELMNQKLATEIELLQYQHYPRFVLNIMDRLEHLAIDKSSLTSDMIIRFSGIMNNLSTRQSPEKISLNKEIDLIRNYFEIQKTGMLNHADINFKVQGKHSQIQIPPFLFFQLIEEGFTHLEDTEKNNQFAVIFSLQPFLLRFNMKLWFGTSFKMQFNPIVLDNFQKYLKFFFPQSHKVISNMNINFVEISTEIYL